MQGKIKTSKIWWRILEHKETGVAVSQMIFNALLVLGLNQDQFNDKLTEVYSSKVAKIRPTLGSIAFLCGGY